MKVIHRRHAARARRSATGTHPLGWRSSRDQRIATDSVKTSPPGAIKVGSCAYLLMPCNSANAGPGGSVHGAASSTSCSTPNSPRRNSTAAEPEPLAPNKRYLELAFRTGVVVIICGLIVLPATFVTGGQHQAPLTS